MGPGSRFPVIHCKLTETALRGDCGTTGKMNAWCVVVLEKLIPIEPRSCMEISSSGRVVLFNQTIQVGTNGMATDTQEERVNLSPEGNCLDGGRSGSHRGGLHQAYHEEDRDLEAVGHGKSHQEDYSSGRE
jgi:hypothetical protein